MLEINHSVLAGPQSLNICLFSTPTQPLFSSRYDSPCSAAASCFTNFRSFQVLILSAIRRGLCELKELICTGNRRLVKTFLIDQEQIINL